MKHQGLNIHSLKTLSTGIIALLVATNGVTLISTQVSANQQLINPNLTAQVPTTAPVIYVNPATGTDAAGAGSTAASPYKTITYALTQAQAGTIIQLAPGNYNSETGERFPLIVRPGVILRGDESTRGQGILITGGGFYTSRTFARQDVTILASENTTIAGLTVTNPNQRGTAVWVESTNPTIKNNTFTKSVRDGVFVTGTGNPKIEGNIFLQNTGNGISVARNAQGEIRNNLFQDTGFGIAIGGTSTPLVVENQIVENQDGLFISESAKPVLRKNVIQNNKRDGIVATVSAQPDLGSSENPGGNLIRNNTRYDVNNATRTNRILAVGNDIDQKKIFGQVDFVAATVEQPGSGTAFRDVSANYWAKGYIEALAAQNIIAGFPDGTFKPNDPVTRAQFATIITKALTPPVKRPAIQFRDVSSNFWAYTAIQAAYQSQFVAGYPDGTFKPQQQIPRVQALVALANGLGLTTDNQNITSIYTDAAQIPNYARSPVAAATARQLVINYPNVNQLNPNREATRAEIAAFVYQALVNAGRAQPLPSSYVVRVP
jgi:parallel beta-helix repeat protein